MSNTDHKDLETTELHVPGYITNSDPGAVGAGILWFDPDTQILRIRNNADGDWHVVVADPRVGTSHTFTADQTFSGAVTMSSTVTMSSLPTSDPTTAGQLWNDAGTVKVSAG